MDLELTVTKGFPGLSIDLDCHITENRCGVFGPSGSGKSTLMHMLAGLTAPDEGRIRLGNRVLFDSRAKVNLPPDKRRIGVVFQHANLFPHMNVAKNLRYGEKRKSSNQSIDYHQVVSILQLKELLPREVTTLSGGEKQRVALGRTILACPELILMDEPLSGLDGRLKYQIIPHLQQVFRDFSIPLIFISHSLQEMRMMAREVLVLKKGELAEKMQVEELAKTTLATGGRGYSNLLTLEEPEDLGDLLRYRWGKTELMLVKTGSSGPGQFNLNSRDILLFKRHPEATSARNMLSCKVCGTYQTGWLVGVELACQSGNRLFAEIVPQSVAELGIRPGAEVVAVIKASAFHKLY